MAKISRPVVYTAVLAVAAYAVFVMTQPDKPSTTARHKTLASKKLGSKGDTFTPQDYTAKFPRLVITVRDSFRPLIMGAAQGKLSPLKLDSIQLTLTGGDANWRYSGTAEINGVREALLENSSTGEAVFLRVGQSWKHAVLSKIESESIVMTGPGGITQRLQLGEQEPTKMASTRNGSPNTPLTSAQTPLLRTAPQFNRRGAPAAATDGSAPTLSSFDDGGQGD